MASSFQDIKFEENRLYKYTSVDERNLMHCVYLSLTFTSVLSLNTIYLKQLRVLVLFKSKIADLDTTNLILLEYLSASETKLTYLDTRSLGKV